MSKALRFVLGLIVALPLTIGAAQAAGGCGPYRYRGVFNQCWLVPPSFRPVVRRIDGIVMRPPVHVQYRRYIRPAPAFYGAGRYVRYANHHQNYHYSHYSYHYNYHYNRHYSFHRNIYYAPRTVGRRGFVDQRSNLINERRFLNHNTHRNVYRRF